MVTRSYQTLTDARKDMAAAGAPPQGLTREQACLWYWQNTNLSLPVISATVGWNDKSIRDLVKAANATRPTTVITGIPPKNRERKATVHVTLPVPERWDETGRTAYRDRVAINRQIKDGDRRSAVKLWNDGLTLDLIAFRLKRNKHWLRTQLKRAGIDLKVPRRSPVLGSPTGLDLGSRASHKGAAAYWWRRT